MNKETDYKPGDPPVPVGTVVHYFGSRTHGAYEVIEHLNPSKYPARPLDANEIEWAFPDGTGYFLWPVGVPRKFGNRQHAIYWARRTSFRIAPENTDD